LDPFNYSNKKTIIGQHELGNLNVTQQTQNNQATFLDGSIDCTFMVHVIVLHLSISSTWVPIALTIL
jgi:hypothetical protein